jgi:hypothetical protein
MGIPHITPFTIPLSENLEKAGPAKPVLIETYAIQTTPLRPCNSLNTDEIHAFITSGGKYAKCTSLSSIYEPPEHSRAA